MGPGNRDREESIGTGRSRMSGSHLNVLDSVPISIIITLVPHAVIISIFLPRVRCQKAVVLKVKARDGWMSSGLPQTGAPTLLTCPPAAAPACSACCCPCKAAPDPGSHQCLCQAHTRSHSRPSPRYTGATQRVGVSSLAWLPPPHPFPCFGLYSYHPVPGPRPTSLSHEGLHPNP